MIQSDTHDGTTSERKRYFAIAGSWQKVAATLEDDVRREVRDILKRGDGIVSGGALGVDYYATDEALKNDCRADQLKIYIPSTLDIYREHYFRRGEEGAITSDQAKLLISQLTEVKSRGSLYEAADIVLNRDTYFRRITTIIENADELIAFQVNQSEGTQDTIDKARKKGIPVKIYSYTV